MANERDIHIDILRCIGLLLVILAHIPINETVKAIRSFDVMLLVFIAGISFVKSGKNSQNFNYKKYLLSRIKRLCVPTWITELIIFATAAILCMLVNRQYLYSIRQILESVFFIGGKEGGIGNVWIVRIYMLMALLTPVFIAVDKKVESTWKIICSFLVLLLINEAIVNLFYVNNTVAGGIIENFISSSICYSVGFFSGVRVAKDSHKSFLKMEALVFGVIFVILQIVLVFYGIGFAPNEFKYPPQIYYSLYGILGSLCMYSICNKIEVKNLTIRNGIIWLSKKSFDMYLAHTIVLKLVSWGDAYLKIYLFSEMHCFITSLFWLFRH